LADGRDRDFASYVAGSWDLLRSRAFRLCRDWDYAADLVQSTLIHAYRRWGLLEKASSRDAYVTTIMARLHYRECQKSRWKAETPMPESLEIWVPEAHTEAVGDRLILAAALAQLGPRQRAVVSLRFLDDLPVDEVAKILRCEPSTVRSQTQRALARLREILRDPESLPTPGTLEEWRAAMNRIERRVREIINPYSTAFARWWCDTGRRTRLGRMIEAAGARLPGRAQPGRGDGAPEAGPLHRPTTSMADRRAAIDAILAEEADDRPGQAGGSDA